MGRGKTIEQKTKEKNSSSPYNICVCVCVCVCCTERPIFSDNGIREFKVICLISICQTFPSQDSGPSPAYLCPYLSVRTWGLWT